MNRDYHLFLGIILIRTEESGFSYFAPDQIPPQIAVDLTEYLETWLMIASEDTQVFESTVRKILKDFYSLFNCPIGWMVTLNEGIETVRVLKSSERFVFLPSKGSESVNLNFLDDWMNPVEAVQNLINDDFLN